MQNKSQEIRVSGKNLDHALSEAAETLGVSLGQLDYRVISQGSGGIFGFLSKKIEISAWKKEINFDAMIGDDDAPEGEVENLSPSEVAALQEDLRLFCEQICSAITGQATPVRATLNRGRLVLDCDDEFLAQQMQKNGKLAEALEHVLRKKPRHIKRELPFRIFVDVRGVRQQRETDLVEMARDLSAKVHENKRPVVLNYKSSYDRKIIHMALDKDDRVYTKSIGSGPNRKLMILPIRKKDEGEILDEQV